VLSPLTHASNVSLRSNLRKPALEAFEAMAFTQSLFELRVGRPVLDVGDFQTLALAALRLISEALLVPMRLHAFAALMLGNFRFASFFERAHSDFQIREFRLNHQMACNAN
jgi:hypothetical protein